MMRLFIVDKIRKFQAYLDRFTRPYPEEIVLSLVLNTASLELRKGKFIELAPVKGCCGPFRLEGNSLPVFTYRVFEKKIMEFIQVRVEVSRPDRIEYTSTIDSGTAPERHGEVVETTDKYKIPFEVLSLHLFRFFPYYRMR